MPESDSMGQIVRAHGNDPYHVPVNLCLVLGLRMCFSVRRHRKVVYTHVILIQQTLCRSCKFVP